MLNTFEPDRRSRIRLRFSESSSLFLIAPKSTEEVQRAWYGKKELTQFKRNALLESKALRHTRTAQVMKYIAHSAATGSKANIRVHNKEKIRGKGYTT